MSAPTFLGIDNEDGCALKPHLPSQNSSCICILGLYPLSDKFLFGETGMVKFSVDSGSVHIHDTNQFIRDPDTIDFGVYNLIPGRVVKTISGERS